MSLSPSERIRSITEISRILGRESWSLIDLTLRQFGIRNSETWHNDDHSAYITAMIQDAIDDKLFELGVHVGIQSDRASLSGIQPPFWRKGMFKLFVSHISCEKKFAGQLQESLLPYGVSCFIAHKDIEPTQEWQTEILTALATCDALIALLHPGFHASNWTDQEVGFVIGRPAVAVAVKLGEEPYGFIGRIQAFDGVGKSPDILAEKIFDAFRRKKQTQRAMAESLVALFEESNTFADAKTRIGYLEELEHWDLSFATRIRNALKGNDQVAGAWGVDDRAAALLEKWK